LKIGGTFGGTARRLSTSLQPFRIQNLEPTAGFEPATRYLQNSGQAGNESNSEGPKQPEIVLS
jgi:hypothetical protein